MELKIERSMELKREEAKGIQKHMANSGPPSLGGRRANVRIKPRSHRAWGSFQPNRPASRPGRYEKQGQQFLPAQRMPM